MRRIGRRLEAFELLKSNPMSVAELGKRLGVTRQNANVLIRRMLEDGSVKKLPNGPEIALELGVSLQTVHNRLKGSGQPPLPRGALWTADPYVDASDLYVSTPKKPKARPANTAALIARQRIFDRLRDGPPATTKMLASELGIPIKQAEYAILHLRREEQIIPIHRDYKGVIYTLASAPKFPEEAFEEQEIVDGYGSGGMIALELFWRV